jgi:AraC family transcriptional regulator of adaptative response/methylated-DNA-[protein]-cysteine methyltransferase
VQGDDYERIEAAIRFLQEHRLEQPTLAEVAEHVGLSPQHAQRVFKRWAGVSPKRFVQHLTLEHAKRLLAESQSVLETTFAVGLSGPGRLHDLAVALEAATPGELKSGGEGVQIAWGVHSSPFGPCQLAVTDRGICWLAFLPDRAQDALEQLQATWPRAALREEPRRTGSVAAELFASPLRGDAAGTLRLLVRGTNFQVQVWRALLRIPPGAVASYSQLAGLLGRPRATRAVASAVAANPISLLIPCHRVLRTTGHLGGYRWGLDRKRALLAWESGARA